MAVGVKNPCGKGSQWVWDSGKEGCEEALLARSGGIGDEGAKPRSMDTDLHQTRTASGSPTLVMGMM